MDIQQPTIAIAAPEMAFSLNIDVDLSEILKSKYKFWSFLRMDVPPLPGRPLEV